MKIKVIVEVTADDIAKGKRGNSICCPIARALKRQFPEILFAVSPSRICTRTAELSPWSMWATTTNEMRDFVEAFDGNRPVEPSTFQLPVEL